MRASSALLRFTPRPSARPHAPRAPRAHPPPRPRRARRYEIDYKVKATPAVGGTPTLEPVDEQETTWTVSVRCVCTTVALTLRPHNKASYTLPPGHDALGVFELRSELGEAAMGERRVYERVGDSRGGSGGAGAKGQQKRQRWGDGVKAHGDVKTREAADDSPLPPMQMFYNSGSKSWQVSRFAENFHLRALSNAGAPEAIFNIKMGDTAFNVGWEVQLDAGENDALIAARGTTGLNSVGINAAIKAEDAAGAEDSSRDVHVACACPGVRISGLPAAHKGNAYLGTFIFTGSHYDGHRVYAAPFEAGGTFDDLKFTHHRFEELYLYWVRASGEWVIGPVVGSFVRFARTTSAAGLPELIGADAQAVLGGNTLPPSVPTESESSLGSEGQWDVASWIEGSGKDHQLIEDDVDTGMPLKVECVWHPKLPPPPTPLKAVHAVGSAAAAAAAARKGDISLARARSEAVNPVKEEPIKEVGEDGDAMLDGRGSALTVSRWLLAGVVALAIVLLVLCTRRPRALRKSDGDGGGRNPYGRMMHHPGLAVVPDDAEEYENGAANEESHSDTASLVRRKSSARAGAGSPQKRGSNGDSSPSSPFRTRLSSSTRSGSLGV